MSQQVPDHWLSIAKKINSIAQAGLTFTKDVYDRERYKELLDLSITILNNITEIDTRKLDFVFNRDIGYQTPKVDELPELSVRRVTKNQILKMYELYKNKELEPIFD